ncbi:MAG: hypothetical protein ACK2T6_02500 [Anaerolineae bacterium]
MRRPTPTVAIAAAIALALMSIGAAAIAAMPSETVADSPMVTALDVYMSDQAGGPVKRTFMSDTHRVYAVVQFEGAANERYDLRLRDLSGIEVFREPVTLSGDGAQSREIAIEDFIGSYEAGVTTQSQALSDVIGDLTNYCQNPPPQPSPWPPQPPTSPTPGAPTPTPDGFSRWRSMMLDAIESSGSISAELSRTLRATGSMPDVQDTAEIVGNLDLSLDKLATAVDKLDQAERAVNPPGVGPGTPTPDPPVAPNPAEACGYVAEAATLVDESLAASAAAIAAIPDDTSTWRIPMTSARYVDGSFSSCLQYGTDLVVPEHETSADSTSWTVGVPGEPALIFPGPELVDKSNLGQIAVSPREMYAASVQVPDVVRQAKVTAFVTDAQCNALSAVTMTLAVDPIEAGTVLPEHLVVSEGLGVATLNAGEVTSGGSSDVTALVCADEACSEPVVGSGSFSVIGPPHYLTFNVNKTTINPVRGEVANLSVRAIDRNGRNVADGSAITVSIAAGDPGVLARDVSSPTNPAMEPELLGKTVRTVTRSGFSNVPPGDDPGLIYSPDLFLMKGTDGEGYVELNAVAASGAAAEPQLVLIKSELQVYLPLALKGYDILATPPFVDPENPPITPTPTPR